MATKNSSVNPTADIVDLDLSAIRKKRFRVDGDDSKILELNTSDLNILPRLKESYPKLQELSKQAAEEWPEDFGEDSEDSINSPEMEKAVKFLRKIDDEMRSIIDYIFDAPVSAVCADSGSMYDPINGQFRYEHIINTLGNLYEVELSSEMDKVSARVQKHTNKYTKKR